MIFIAHRGNVKGIDPTRENSPSYIFEAQSLGYDVEIDVWRSDNKWYLGHDDPQYLIEEAFLLQEGLWCHAKNMEALEALHKLGANFFWHQNDCYTLTSRGYIWAYPGKALCSNSICVMPERFSNETHNFDNCVGICSDNVEHFRELLNEVK